MAQILKRLRSEMIKNSIDLYFMPRTDEHQSEYLVPSDQRVQFVSGFTGSNALSLVSQNNAYLWTDGRYLLQAQKQLYTGWQLKKSIEGEQKWFDFVSSNFKSQTKIGFDPKIITAQNAVERIKYFSSKGLSFHPIQDNLVDKIWDKRPQIVMPQIYIHEDWAGRPIKEKVKWVRENIQRKGGKSAIFNDLSQICWILNLRSSEIPHNPFFKSILRIDLEGGCLYLPKANRALDNSQIKQFLLSQQIQLAPYQPSFNEKSLICKNQLNYYIYNQIKDRNPVEWEGIGLYRAVRNQKQINGFRRCHYSDGIAMAKFWSWRSKQAEVDQYDCAEKIDQFRYSQPFNKGLSFDTISGGGPNAAIIHYRPTKFNSSKITKNMIHLLDSGGQYLDGTTDVTRAFHFGEPTPQEKDSYTRVLLGNLDLQRLKWPANKLTGADIDVLARRHLWKVGKDYLHGTGHGVGHFGGVHEGPVSISRLSKTKFQSGMIVTNEPGYYQSGKYGIRIENMLLVQEQNGFNYFEVLTLCPYDRNLIKKELLNNDDVQHINKYHARVLQILAPGLQDDQQAINWLQASTKPL